jgi:hypothetical protein
MGKMLPAGTPVRVTLVEAGEQLSSALAEPRASSPTRSEHESVVTVTSSGAVIVGAVASVPVMVIACTQDAMLALTLSVAVQVI